MYGPDGSPVLSGVTQNGHADVAKLLLDASEQPNLRTYQGYTPLALAAEVSALQLSCCDDYPLLSCLVSSRKARQRLHGCLLQQV